MNKSSDPFSLKSAPEIKVKKNATYTKTNPFANDSTKDFRAVLPAERTSHTFKSSSSNFYWK